MSEPTKQSLKRAVKFVDDLGCIFLKGDDEKLAREFDAIRAEEHQKAEKLAKALRSILPCTFGCTREREQASVALADYERSAR